MFFYPYLCEIFVNVHIFLCSYTIINYWKFSCSVGDRWFHLISIMLLRISYPHLLKLGSLQNLFEGIIFAQFAEAA